MKSMRNWSFFLFVIEPESVISAVIEPFSMFSIVSDGEFNEFVSLESFKISLLLLLDNDVASKTKFDSSVSLVLFLLHLNCRVTIRSFRFH